LGTADKARFIHRRTEAGRYESICLRCFRTIGGAALETGLGAVENGHMCSQEDLIQLHVRMEPEPVRFDDRKKDSA
jgi:hypothetical protein